MTWGGTGVGYPISTIIDNTTALGRIYNQTLLDRFTMDRLGLIPDENGNYTVTTAVSDSLVLLIKNVMAVIQCYCHLAYFPDNIPGRWISGLTPNLTTALTANEFYFYLAVDDSSYYKIEPSFTTPDEGETYDLTMLAADFQTAVNAIGDWRFKDATVEIDEGMIVFSSGSIGERSAINISVPNYEFLGPLKLLKTQGAQAFRGSLAVEELEIIAVAMVKRLLTETKKGELTSETIGGYAYSRGPVSVNDLSSQEMAVLNNSRLLKAM